MQRKNLANHQSGKPSTDCKVSKLRTFGLGVQKTMGLPISNGKSPR